MQAIQAAGTAEAMEAIVSKVLILEEREAERAHIRAFCIAHQLVPLRAQVDSVLAVLKSNLDLGAIFLANHFAGDPRGGLLMARRIHAVRPELPIYLRCGSRAEIDAMSDADARCVSASYTLETIDSLGEEIARTLFNLRYPSALVRGIGEITRAALCSQFNGLEIDVERPYVVKDRLIYGEISTLIPIEGSWCRGYMMLQADELDLMQTVRAEHTHIQASGAADFRNLNALLGELTNLIWGAFKNRFINGASHAAYAGQVPIVINHLHRYISFGSDNPQLCFQYVLRDPSDSGRILKIHQRFVFNLSWSPEDFSENTQTLDALVDSGELELF
jgi:CheY-specific phosphatase CheX